MNRNHDALIQTYLLLILLLASILPDTYLHFSTIYVRYIILPDTYLHFLTIYVRYVSQYYYYEIKYNNTDEYPESKSDNGRHGVHSYYGAWE